ncbi:MAG: histidine kinase [Candidatus Aminicenantaceae bacterium]
MGLFWSPIVFCVILLQSRLSGLALSDAAILMGPLMGFELFICLSIWFPCRAFSTDRFRLPQLLLRHVLLAALMTAVWLLLGVLYSEILGDLSGNPVWRVKYDQALPLLLATGLFLYFMFSLIYYMVLALEKSRQSEQKALENLLSTRSAELSSLRASIHPHFLFNSLTSLSTLTRKSPELAQKIILQLAGFLRYSLNYGQKGWVRVRDELDHIEDYLGIEKMRLGERLQYEFSIESDTLEEMLPPFTLLPLVENAVKHGFQQSLEPGLLTMSIKKTPMSLIIEVENPFKRAFQTKQGEGYGLAGLKKRLTNAYRGEAGLAVAKNERSFKVTLRLPLKEGMDDLP